MSRFNIRNPVVIAGLLLGYICGLAIGTSFRTLRFAFAPLHQPILIAETEPRDAVLDSNLARLWDEIAAPADPGSTWNFTLNATEITTIPPQEDDLRYSDLLAPNALFYLFIRCPSRSPKFDKELASAYLDGRNLRLSLALIEELSSVAFKPHVKESVHRLVNASSLTAKSHLASIIIFSPHGPALNPHLTSIFETHFKNKPEFSSLVIAKVLSHKSLANEAAGQLLFNTDAVIRLLDLDSGPTLERLSLASTIPTDTEFGNLSSSDQLLSIEEYVLQRPYHTLGIHDLAWLEKIPNELHGMALKFWAQRSARIDPESSWNYLSRLEDSKDVKAARYELARGTVNIDPLLASKFIIELPRSKQRDKLIEALLQSTRLNKTDEESWRMQLTSPE